MEDIPIVLGRTLLLTLTLVPILALTLGFSVPISP